MLPFTLTECGETVPLPLNITSHTVPSKQDPAFDLYQQLRLEVHLQVCCPNPNHEVHQRHWQAVKPLPAIPLLQSVSLTKSSQEFAWALMVAAIKSMQKSA